MKNVFKMRLFQWFLNTVHKCIILNFRIGVSTLFIGRHLVFLSRPQHQPRFRMDQLQPLLDGLDAKNHGRFESNAKLSQCSIRWGQLRRSKSFVQRAFQKFVAFYSGSYAMSLKNKGFLKNWPREYFARSKKIFFQISSFFIFLKNEERTFMYSISVQ